MYYQKQVEDMDAGMDSFADYFTEELELAGFSDEEIAECFDAYYDD